MTTAFGLIGAFTTVLAAGFGLGVLMSERRVSFAEQFGRAWLLGTAFVSFAFWFAGFVLHGAVLQGVISALAVLLGATGVIRWRCLTPNIEKVFRPPLEIISRVVFALEFIGVVALALQHTLGWDGLTVWELKGRYAFLNGGHLPPAYFSDTSRWFSHPEYPLLLPLTETWFYFWIGDCDQYWIKLIFPIWYLAGMSFLFRALEDVSGRRWVAWAIVLLFPLVPAVHWAPGGVSVAYADVPLAAIYVASIFYLLRLFKEKSREALNLVIAFATTLIWMKREGTILWFAVIICVAAIVWCRADRTGAIVSFIPGILLLGLWKIFLSAMHALPSRDFAAVTPKLLAANIGRFGAILRELYLIFAAGQLWDVFWLLAALAFAAVAVRERTRLAALVLWLLFAPLFAYAASYIFSAWPDYIAHMDTSLPRLLIQLMPAAWLLIALALRTPSIQPGPPGPQPVSQSGRGTDCN